MSLNARESAMLAIYRIENEGAYLNKAAFDATQKCEPRDKGFVNELVMGTVRNKLYLDFIIQSYSKIKLKKLSPYVLAILRISVYQLIKMDKIPQSAACNEGTKLANKYANKGARGYINGVLRTISRERESLPMPKGSRAEQISVLYSCPLWITQRLINQFGKDKCEVILKDSLLPHPTTIRVNKTKISQDELISALKEEGITAEHEREENCLKILGAIDVKKSKAYSEGLYTLQNINSMRAGIALEPKKNQVVVDVCSAPGGKTTHIAELMENCGKIYAFDVHPHKIQLIEKSAKRLGLDIIEARCHNSEETLDELTGVADRVLADVPCSGVGTIHKKPDVKYNRCEEDIKALCQIQQRILRASSKYVKVGGILVYSTCTILNEENREQIDLFLKENNDFEFAEDKLYLADETGGSGFYICKIRKTK